ncbi:MAG: FapA family protein [Candidatus Cloacimonetes bacterium]|nr:FapA family protein [Candidatus Cloacimonadota bacterium]
MDNIINGKVYANQDKSLLLTISKDNLSAYLTIENNSKMLDEKEITALISSVGIKYGFENAKQYNEKNEIKKELGKPFLIARSIAENSQPGITFLFEADSCINFNEHYELEDLSDFIKVEKDQALADVSRGDSKEEGKDIFGKSLKESTGSKINVEEYFGNNVYFSAETNQMLAADAGYPYFDRENRICVKTSFISEDIDNTTKTIYGNTTIDGVISNSNLEIFGDLWVKGNIRDCLSTGIIVHGNVILDYAERAKISASGEITINKSARNSLIYANGAIKAADNCSISGGVIQSGIELQLFSVGSPLGILTEVEIGIKPFTKQQIKIIGHKLNTLRRKSEADEESAIVSLVDQLKSLQTEFSEISENPINQESLTITIKEKVYPNSEIRILKDKIEFTEEKHSIEISVGETGLVINEVDKI